MLSDEEKKAIDYLKIYIERDVMYENRHYKQIEIILNLIEKQSKEIESLKEDKEIIKRKYEDLVDENEKFLYDSAVYLMGKDDTNSKWKDKIKAKIEVLDKEEKEKLKGTKGQDRYAIKQEYMYKRSVLQSLLEKE